MLDVNYSLEQEESVLTQTNWSQGSKLNLLFRIWILNSFILIKVKYTIIFATV